MVSSLKVYVSHCLGFTSIPYLQPQQDSHSHIQQELQQTTYNFIFIHMYNTGKYSLTCRGWIPRCVSWTVPKRRYKEEEVVFTATTVAGNF